MKEKAKEKMKIILVVIIVLLILLIVGVISAPSLIERTGIKVGEKEDQEAGTAQVLSGKTFTSSAAGVGASGTMANYSSNIQTVTLSASETGTVTKTVPAGYHTQLTVDASAVYNKGYTDGNILGKEVSIGSEPFFVLYENSIDNTVTLFAKYCLKTDGSSQSINGGTDTYKCVFSSTNYWSSYWVSGQNLNLNTVNGNVAGDAITKAQVYARSLGGTKASGRLLTYEEANAIKEAIPKVFDQEKYNFFSRYIERGYMTEEEAREMAMVLDPSNHKYQMLYGKYNTASGEAFLYYWLGSSHGSHVDNVWYVDGYTFYSNSITHGVRPVITVPTSVVSGL